MRNLLFYLILVFLTNVIGCGSSNFSKFSDTTTNEKVYVFVTSFNTDYVLFFSAENNMNLLNYCVLDLSTNGCVPNTKNQASPYKNFSLKNGRNLFVSTKIQLNSNSDNLFLIELISGDKTYQRKIKIFYDKTNNSQISAEGYDYNKDIQWTQIPYYGPQGINISQYGPHYEDVLSHTYEGGLNPRSRGFVDGVPSVDVHEIGHMLHAQITEKAGWGNYEGVYYEKGKAVVFSKPRTKISEIRSFIPSKLKNDSIYNQYIISQPSRQPSLDNVAYLFDEWAAYCMNIRVSLELEDLGKPERNGWGSNGAPLFFGYIATGLHVMLDKEPQKLEDKQFKAVFALFAEYTWEYALHKALKSPKFGSEAKFYINYYVNDPEFAPIKNSLIKIYGQEWVNRVIRD